MWKSRRNFIRESMFSAAAIAASSFVTLKANAEDKTEHLTVLHTNDMHSHLEAFAMDGSANQGMGGVAARASIINAIRDRNEHVLLFDAGDIFGSTPYFDLYKGEPEIKAMSQMKYDAVTIGENDLRAGIINYADKMKQYADFPVVNCNYDCAGTALNSIVKPYKVFQKGSLKIGVTGVGIDFQGLLAEDLYNGITYLNPIESVNNITDVLRKKEDCGMIVCLSHLGDKYYDGKVSDDILARETDSVDLIIGGHTHQAFMEPKIYINKKGKEVVVNQSGWAGMQIGRLDYNFLDNGKKILDAKLIVIGKKYED